MPQAFSFSAFSGLNSRSQELVGALAPSTSLTFCGLKPMPIEPHMYGMAWALSGSLAEAFFSSTGLRFFQFDSFDLSSS
ncbi:hypothetical protein D3C75_853030 [compost metagenome]